MDDENALGLTLEELPLRLVAPECLSRWVQLTAALSARTVWDIESRAAAMEIVLQTEAPPLRQDANGDLRVGTSRLLLDLVIHAFLDGATPEAIAQRYPSASLSDVYAVIAYYLRHRDEIEAYLEERERRAAQVRERIESRQGDLAHLRSRLLARDRSA